MAANAKPGPEPAYQSSYNSVVGLLGDWIRQGTEGFVATQKIVLDLAAQQNALALTVVRERLGFTPLCPKELAGFGGQSIKNLTEVQRQVLDSAARQNSILAEGLKPITAQTPIESLAEVLHQGVDCFITTQKQLLDLIEAQAEGAVNDYGEGRPFETGRMADLARDMTRNLLESQKQFLDIVKQQLTTKQESAGNESGNGSRRVDVFDMVKKSVDSLIEAQQHLLDVASSQVKANVKFAQDLLTSEARPTRLTDVVKKSVDSFMAAQKAVAELAYKSRKAAAGAEQTTA